MNLMRALVTALTLAIGLESEVAFAPVASGSELTISDRNAASEPLAIVVNQSNPIDDLSFAELRKVFLGERSYWSNGRRITVVMRDPEDLERKVILRDVYGMTEEQLKTHVLRGLFTGEILVSPKILSTASGVRKFIFNVPGGIGYIRLSDVDPSVKIVRVDQLLPEDRGYRLHIRSQAVD
jgi:ABC-type phosphate transport system substrate-binding protein